MSEVGSLPSSKQIVKKKIEEIRLGRKVEEKLRKKVGASHLEEKCTELERKADRSNAEENWKKLEET